MLEKLSLLKRREEQDGKGGGKTSREQTLQLEPRMAPRSGRSNYLHHTVDRLVVFATAVLSDGHF